MCRPSPRPIFRRSLEPDLVLTFSDLQAKIAAELIGAGIAVHAFNQRDIAGILAMIRTIGALAGAANKAEALARSYEARLNEVAASVRGRRKPKVYFEEWDDPLISGIGWVSGIHRDRWWRGGVEKRESSLLSEPAPLPPPPPHPPASSRSGPLRANDDETNTCREFTLGA